MEPVEILSVDAEVADATLMASLRLGDRAAFRSLYDRYAADVLAVCRRILAHHADAEDATADVFCEVWQRRQRYDCQRSSPRTYLVLLARSRAIDRLRSRQARHDRPAGTAEQDATASKPDSRRNPDESACQTELAGQIQSALAALNSRQRQAMELSFFEGLSHQQIADRLGAPLGTVKTHIRKGLEKLRCGLRSSRLE